MYCAIIGDIINSKSIKNREHAQNMLREKLDELNGKYHENIASNFSITLGDEFQALLSSPENILEIIDDIRDSFLSIGFRFGIGFGEITTSINPELSVGADGPAYYNARGAIVEIKNSEKKYERPFCDTKLSIALNNDQTSPEQNIVNLINSCLSLSSYIKNKWTDNQKRVIYFAKKGLSQREIAQEMEKQQSAIQRSLSASGYYTYKDAYISAQKSLNYLWRALNAK